MVQVDKPAEGQEEVKLETIGESVVKRKARKLLETLPEKRNASSHGTQTKRPFQLEVSTVFEIL